MIIIGCDCHPGFQQIAFVDTDTGEWNERKLGHCEEAEQFYRQLRCAGKKCVSGWTPVRCVEFKQSGQHWIIEE